MAELLNREDLRFMLYEWLEVDRLLQWPRFAEHSRWSFDTMLDQSAEIAERYFASHRRRSDEEEPVFDGDRVRLPDEVSPALHAFIETGLLSATLDEEVGGIQLPSVIADACFAWFQAGNIATSGYLMLSMANAHLLVVHGTPEQVDTYARPQLEGRWFGTMALSESAAGSSLADVATTGVRQQDGSYRLVGEKMWISAAEHDLSENIVNLVLARTDDAPAGVKGLSLFIVPKYLVNSDGSLGERNDVSLVGLNHKMGYRGTVNTALAFGEGTRTPAGQPGAVAFLVGQEGQGLAIMFHMMNAARVSIGAGAAALGYAGYLHSLEYAKERLQGRALGAKDPATPQVPLIRHADVRRMLLAQKSYVEGGLGLTLYAARLVDQSQYSPDADERRDCGLLLDVLTPIVKSWPSQWCLAANDLAIQVLGGAGYTRDHPVEQLWRDNRLNPIHEGTHGIQGLDLLGRKVVYDGGAGLSLLVSTIIEAIESAADEGTAYAAALRKRLSRLVEVTTALWAGQDPTRALANATVYLEAAGHIVIAWIWLEQLTAASGKDGRLYAGKREAARYFFTYELPKVDAQLDLLASGDDQLVTLDEQCL